MRIPGNFFDFLSSYSLNERERKHFRRETLPAAIHGRVGFPRRKCLRTMDSKKTEPIKHPSPHAEPTELTEAEVAQLRALLQEVYPVPSHSIKDSVMARIHAEAEADAARISQKADKAAARRKRQALFMKWGGMAACVTILCGALVIATPMLSQSGGTAADEAAMTMAAPTEAVPYADTEAQPETAAAEENGAPAIKRSMLMTTSAYQATMEDADAIQETEAAVAQTTAAPMEEKSVVVEEAAEQDNAANSVLCDGLPTRENMPAATAEEREAFVSWLIANGSLTADVYRAWLTDKGYTDAADWQATELCEAFGLDIALIEAWANEP